MSFFFLTQQQEGRGGRNLEMEAPAAVDEKNEEDDVCLSWELEGGGWLVGCWMLVV